MEIGGIMLMHRFRVMVLSILIVFSCLDIFVGASGQNEIVQPTHVTIKNEPMQGEQRVVLVEEFTSWNSIPCAAYNPYMYAAIENYGYSKVAPGFIHTWWPNPMNDPFYLNNPQNSQSRVAFYDGAGAPDMYIDGVDYPQYPIQAAIEGYFENQLDVPPGVAITTKGTLDPMGLTGTISAHVEAIREIPGTDLRVMFYLWENNVTNVGSGDNGETEFKWAVWDMLPDANGTSISLINPGDQAIVSHNFTIDPTWDINELGISVFVQDFASRYVEQSAVEEFENPAVTLITPDPITSGQVFRGNITIDWVATDFQDDDGTLDITVEYSPDAGTTWLPIMSGIDNNSPPYVWDTIAAGVPDGANYFLRVIAVDSDGRSGSGKLSQSIERFSIDNTFDDKWYLQIESTNLPPHLDLDMKPFESSVQEVSVPVLSPGEYGVEMWASQYTAPSDVDLVGEWIFTIFARVTWDMCDGFLYANVYGDNGTGPRLLFTTGYDDEAVGSHYAHHEFNWTYNVPNGTTLFAGERVIVEIMLHAISGAPPDSHVHYATSDIPVMVNLTNDYTFTFVSDQQREILDEISSANGSIAQVVNESFSGGIPPDWTIINKGGGGGVTKSWTTANPANRSANLPIEEPFVIVDSAAHGPLEMDEQLITPRKDLSFATAVTLEFDQFYLDDENKSEHSQVDVRSSLTGGAWVNVLDQSGNTSTNPDHKSINLTSLAAGASDVEVRFYYSNAYNASYWIVDNVILQGYIHTSMLEHKWRFNVTPEEPPYRYRLEAKRPISPDRDDFLFSYSLDDENYTNMFIVDMPAEKYYTYTFPPDITDTVFIRVIDTDRASGNVDVSKLVVDCMNITSGPPRLIIGFDHFSTPSMVQPAFTYSPTAHLCIQDAPGGTGVNVTTHTMTTDDTFTVWANGFDDQWSYVTELLVSWNNTLNTQAATYSSSFTLDPKVPGTGIISAEFETLNDTTDLITVLPGATTLICIQDAPGGAGTNITTHLMTADQTLTLYAVGYDAEWNAVGEANCTWFTTGSLDVQNNIGSNFTFDPVTAPSSGTIKAAKVTSNLTDSTGTITVIPGALVNLCILDQPGGSSIPGVNVTNHTMTVGDTLVLWSVGFDADWNYINNIPVNWSNDIDSQTATLSQAFIFAPTTPGSGFVLAEFNSTINDTAGLIVVLPGALNRIFTRDAPGGMGNIVCGHTMTTDETLTVWAAGYDEYGNYLGDIECNWSTTGTLDNHTATGVNNLTFDPWTAGTDGFITGVWDGIPGTAGMIIVVPGALDHVIVRNMPGGGGSEVMDVVLILGQEMTVYSAGYDAEGNYIGDVPCNWTTTGTLNLTIAMMTSSFTFRPAAAGENGTILGVFNTTIQDETGIITVIDHAIDYIVIEDGSGVEITTHTMDVTETLIAYAIAYNNSVGRIGPFNVNWTTTGTLDHHNSTLSQSLTFVPIHAPTSGTFEASLGTLFDTTETITVNLGSLAHICIQDISGGMGTNVTTHTMTTDQTLTVHAVGYDATWNYLSSIVVNWSNTLNAQTASDAKQFTFNPLTPGTGIIIAEFNATVSDTTGLITVLPGSLAHIILRDSPGNMGNQVGAVSMTTDDTLTIWSAGYDAEWNYIGDVNCRWFTNQTLDDQTVEDVNTFTFDPVTANTQGHILAMNILIFGVTPTGLITVGTGALHQLIIRDAPGGSGMEVNYRMLLPGQSLTLYSAGYDADGNFIADIPCNWTTAGTLNFTTATTSPSFTFTPAGTGESGNITAIFNATVHDDTGLIYVPDYGIDYIMITNNMGVEITTHTMDTSETFKVWAIGYNDSIGAIGLVSVDWTTTGSLDLQTENMSWAFTFDPVHAPTSGTIEASLVTMSDSTGIITVNPGPITHLCTQDAPGGGGNNITTHSMTTSETLTLWAVGYDAEWNYASEALSLWSTTGTLDPQAGLGTSFTFDPATAPTQGTITAFDAASGQWGETGNITVVYPPLAYLCIQDSPGGLGANVTTHTMTTDETFTVWAIGFDAGWNYVYDTVVDWSNTLTPQISVGTSSFTFNPSITGQGIITAVLNATISDSTGNITVVPGALAHILIRDSPGGIGNEVGAVSMTTDDTLSLWSAGYDAEWNYIGDVVCSFWFTNQTLDLQIVLGDSSFIFDPATAGTSGYITVVNTPLSDSTGLITVGSGVLDHVKILDSPGGTGTEVGDVLMTLGQSLTLYAAGYDADGNYLGDIPCNWTTTGTLDPTTETTSTSFTFTPAAGGETGTIEASFNVAIMDSTGTITVTDWTINYIIIEDGLGTEITTHVMDATETFTVWAMGYNNTFGLIGPVNVNWTTTGTLDIQSATTSQSFTFDPSSAPTSGTFEAILGSLVDSTGLITVIAGPLTHLCIQDAPGGTGLNVTTHTMSTAETLTVWAIGFDAEWNYMGEVPSNWTNTLNPQTATMTASFTLVPIAPGSGIIIADFNASISDSTGLITVTAPAVFDIDLTGIGPNTWVLVSFPINVNGDVLTIFNDTTWGDGSTTWDYVQWYDPLDMTDHWKCYATFKPPILNDLPGINNTMALWVHITANGGDQMLTVGDGVDSANTTINLYTGWNMVGYPANNDSAYTVGDLKADTGATSVEGYNGTAPYLIVELGDTFVLRRGEGYWVKVDSDTIWNVDW